MGGIAQHKRESDADQPGRWNFVMTIKAARDQVADRICATFPTGANFASTARHRQVVAAAGDPFVASRSSGDGVDDPQR